MDGQRFVKGCIDRFAALVGIMLLWPLMLVIAAVIRATQGAPVLFRQVRPGFRTRPFELVKFRTMREAFDEQGELLPDADRVTAFGRFLRSTSLDELPQLWNVLKGELSLVGPRPLMMCYLDRYSPRQARRHEVMPGITGWSQINGRNAIDWATKLELDVWYVENWSLWLDFRILARTVVKVAQRSGINPEGPPGSGEFLGTAGSRAGSPELKGGGMGMVELIGTDDPRWQRLVETGDPDDYQFPGWAEISARCGQGWPYGLYGRGARGEFLLPLNVRDLPGLGVPELSGWRDAISPYGYPGALVRGSFEAELERVGGWVREALREHRILTCFIRMNPMRSNADPILEQLGTLVDGGETVFYDLQLPDAAILGGVKREHQKDVEELLDSGHTTRIDDWSDLPAFKALYRNTMKRVRARTFYLFDDAYFERMRDVLGERLHLITVVAPEGGVLSAGLFLTGGEGTAHAHLSGTANSRVEASKLLYDTAWRWHKARGVRALHMGGGMGRPNDDLLRFKRGLAKGRKVFRTARVVSDPELYGLACAATGTGADDLQDFFPPYRRTGLGSPVPVAPAARARDHDSEAVA